MIRQFQIIGGAALGLAGLIQMAIFSSVSTLACVAIVWGGCALVALISFHQVAFRKFPISTLQVITFTVSNLAVPLIGTTLDGRPIIFNLREPVESFGFSALTALTLAVVHWIYRRMQAATLARDFISRRLMGPTGFFAPPATYQLWAIGVVGCLAMMAESFVFNKYALDTRGFLQQVVHGFTSFSYAPFLIPVAHLFWAAKKPNSRTWFVFGLYFSFVAILSMALNQRGAFAIPLVTMLGCVLLAMLTGRLQVNLFSIKIALPILIFIFIGVPQLADLATAMRIARSQKLQLSSGAMVGRSIELFFEKKKLSDYRKSYLTVSMGANDYNENYLKNEFLQRFTFLKYTDNDFYYTRDFGKLERQRLAQFELDRLYGQIPSPVLNLLGIRYNKWATLSMSFGDFVYYARTGFEYAGFRTGSFIAIGLAVYGGYFFLIFGVVAFFICLLSDCFSLRMSNSGKGEVPGPKSDYFARISPMVLMYLFLFAFYFNNEDIVTFIGGFIRLIPQDVILYLILFHLTGPLKLFFPAPRTVASPPVRV